jgi:two-component system nitrate/nitrite response regulator NarL
MDRLQSCRTFSPAFYHRAVAPGLRQALRERSRSSYVEHSAARKSMDHAVDRETVRGRPDAGKDRSGGRLIIRVLVVSGIRIYREGLALALAQSHSDRIVCAGTAADAPSAAAAAQRLQPDVALVDVTMSDALAAMTAVAATARTVALGVGGDDRAVVSCAEAGVCGYLTRDDSLEHVAGAIEAVARGEALCPPEVGAALLRRVTALGSAPAADGAGVHLTAREAQIVELIGQGLANKTIAQRLCIELPTVKNHVHNIFEKLGVSRRAEAAAWLRTHRGDDRTRALRPS